MIIPTGPRLKFHTPDFEELMNVFQLVVVVGVVEVVDNSVTTLVSCETRLWFPWWLT